MEKHPAYKENHKTPVPEYIRDITPVILDSNSFPAKNRQENILFPNNPARKKIFFSCGKKRPAGN